MLVVRLTPCQLDDRNSQNRGIKQEGRNTSLLSGWPLARGDFATRDQVERRPKQVRRVTNLGSPLRSSSRTFATSYASEASRASA